MHNSHSEQQGGGTVKKNEGPAKPPLFVYCRWSSSVHPPLKPAGHTCDRNLRCLRVKEITSCLGCRTLCVDGSSQATFLTKRSLSPSPRCLRCSGVPFGCSSGHGRMFCYGSQGISIWMTPKNWSRHTTSPHCVERTLISDPIIKKKRKKKRESSKHWPATFFLTRRLWMALRKTPNAHTASRLQHQLSSLSLPSIPLPRCSFIHAP